MRHDQESPGMFHSNFYYNIAGNFSFTITACNGIVQEKGKSYSVESNFKQSRYKPNGLGNLKSILNRRHMR